MKGWIKKVALGAMLALTAAMPAGAQSLSNIISTAKGVVEDLTASSSFDIADIAGSYKYSAPAVALKGDNALKNIGGSAAATQVEEKLAPMYKTMGFDKLEMTIGADSTFTMKVHSVSLSGTIAKDEQGLVFTFDKLKGQPVSCLASKSGNNLQLCFDASKIIKVMDTVSNYFNISTLKTLNSLLQSYDDLYVGFELTKVGDAAGAAQSSDTDTKSSNPLKSLLKKK